MSSIEDHIEHSNIEENFHVFSGHCLSIAVALQEYFGGEVVVVSEIPGEGFDHALIEKDGLLYDGSGQVGWTETVNRFVAPEARAVEPEPHYRKLNHPKDEFRMTFNRDVYEDVLEALEEAVEDSE
jgi:hypothetical protein